MQELRHEVSRVLTAGAAAEGAPTALDDSRAFYVPGDATPRPPQGLRLLAVGADARLQVYMWIETLTVAQWVSYCTTVARNGVPAPVPLPRRGAYCVRALDATVTETALIVEAAEDLAPAASADPAGNLNIAASIKDFRAVVPTGSPLPLGPCDAVRVTTDGNQLAVHPSERPATLPLLTSSMQATPTGPTAPAGWWQASGATGWVVGGGVLTGAVGATQGATGSLWAGGAAVTPHQSYLVTTVIATGPTGCVQPVLGGQAGATLTAAGTYREVIRAGATGTDYRLIANGFRGNISEHHAHPLTPPLSSRQWEPIACKSVLAEVTAGFTLTPSGPAYVGYYRGPQAR